MSAAVSSRDYQRQGIYNAENRLRRLVDNANAAEATHGVGARTVEIAGSSMVLPVERRFGDLDGIQRYVDAVLALSWVKPIGDPAGLTVRVAARRHNAHAHYQRLGVDGGPTLYFSPRADGEKLGRWSMREIVVLHEIAHFLTDDERMGHGPLFAAKFLELVDGIMGAEAAFILRVAFHDEGVDVGSLS